MWRSDFEVRLTDDLSGTKIPCGKGEVVTFSLDGTSYEIDLTAKNAGVLRNELRPYITAGRPIQGSRRRRPVRTKVGADARTGKAWARANRYQVRERLPNEVLAAFEAAN
jgi:Lsr2